MGKTIKSNVRKLLHTMISKFKQKQEEKEAVFQEKQQCLDAISDFLENFEDIEGLSEIKNTVERLRKLEKKSSIETQTKFLEEISLLTGMYLHRFFASEVSTLSICMIDKDKSVVGFMALCDRPNVPGLDPADWECWIRNMYQRYYMSRNTLFIHLMCSESSVKEFFLDEALMTVFDSDLYLHQIVLIVPACSPEDVLLKFQAPKKRTVYKYCAKYIDESDNSPNLYTFFRNDFCPKLKMRRAVEEDNDDIIEMLDKKCPRLKDLYGNYYLSELIGRHPESKRKIIVAEQNDRAVGVMCLNTDINYKKLQSTYELTPFFGLMKATPLEKEQQKRDNDLLHMFGEPIMNGKWSPFQHINKLEASSYVDHDNIPSSEKLNIRQKKFSRVNFGRNAAMRKSLDQIIYRSTRDQRHSDDFSEKAYSPSLSQTTNYSVVDMLDEDPFDYEIVNIDNTLLAIPHVLSCEQINRAKSWKEPVLSYDRKRRRSSVVKQINLDDINTVEYHGEPNAFCIELLAFQDHMYERHYFDLLEAAFEIMKNYDYCIIRTPCSEGTFALLQHFCFVPTKTRLCSKYALYVAHRASVLGKLRVRQAEVIDVPQISLLLQQLESKDTLWTIESCILNKEQHKAYVFTSGFSIIGIGILEPPEQMDFIRAKFNLDMFHCSKYHFRELGAEAGFATLKAVLTYPAFEVHYRFFARDMMRLAGCNSLLWLTAYRSKWIAHKANSIASAMIPLTPRKSEIDCTVIKELKHIHSLSHKITAFSAWFIGKKLTMVPKMDINTRIVVIGASRTAIAFLNTLLFDAGCTYLNFTSVTLISPHGLPYMRHAKPIAEMMFPRYRTSTDKYLKSVPYTYYVNVVQGTLVEIDTTNNFVKLFNGGKYYYDMLFILLGKQYQHPNYLKNIYRKERLMKYGYTPPYIRLDVPRYTDSETQICTENIPENVFIVNDIFDANKAINYVSTLFWQNNHKVLVYGASIDAYCCISALIELKIPSENIAFIEPFPPDDRFKSRVSVFCNYNVDQTIGDVINNLGITVYRSYYFQSWTVDNYNSVTHVDFLSHYQVVRLECAALFYYGRKGINVQALEAINKSGITYDGGILIDNKFKTRAPGVYAAGPVTRYHRRYFADEFRQKYYDSYEVGEKLGTLIRNQLDPLFTPREPPQKTVSDYLSTSSASSDRLDGSSTSKKTSESTDDQDLRLPKLKQPLMINCKLPGGLQYLEVRPPGLKTPHHYVQSLDFNGYVMETFVGGYFKLHLNTDYIVDGITCLCPGTFPLENFRNLYGLSASVLNNVHLRYTAKKLDDFYKFFRAQWAFFLYHDQCHELFVMAKELLPKGQRNGSTLQEAMSRTGHDLSNPSYRFNTRMEIRSKFEQSQHVDAIIDYVLEWLSEHDVLLPMYMHPGHLPEFTFDLEIHPAFKKKKNNLRALLKKIF